MIVGAKGFLVFASLFFYSWWNVAYLPIILSSMIFNYVVGNSLNENFIRVRIHKKTLLAFGVVTNLILLGYFKYSDFLIENFNIAFDSSASLLHLVLPLAISFFTFQQIAYLVDSYRKETVEYDFLNYALFVSFFPQLIAGPIVHHAEMMPQFASKRNLIKNYNNIALGLFIFSMGVFKKVVIADGFSKWATAGFDHAEALNLIEAWSTSLSYTFQLYFDFSGYTDMAIGAALLFNIKLPINFNSPYKALDIQDFWRRWHITLSRFLRDYVYIPLGGSRNGKYRTYNNLLATFVLGGIWHGAGWTFIFWGALHGMALVIHRFWKDIGMTMPKILAWFVTFNFVNIGWVFFRAEEWSDAIKVLKGMLGGDLVLNYRWFDKLEFLHGKVEFGAWMQAINGDKYTLLAIFMVLILCLTGRNSMQFKDALRLNKAYLFSGSLMLTFALLKMHEVSEFLYFNF